MSNEALANHIFITLFLGLISGVISFFIIRALTKKIHLSGVLSIVLGFILSISFFSFNNLGFCIAWVIGTCIFWFSASKHEKKKQRRYKNFK